jgi:hypothetical protein
MVYLGMTIAFFMLRYALADKTAFSRQVYFVVLFGLFLFSAFRYQVGCDWSGYYYQYLNAEGLDWSVIMKLREPIWLAILGWIQDKGLPYPVVNVVSSAVFFLGVHVLARRQPDPLGFLVLIFPILIINMPMSGIRQGAAIGILCIAFAAFIDRRPLWYTFWVIVAAGVHVSALAFILLLPLATGSYTQTRLMLTAILAVPGAYVLGTGDAAELATERYIATGVDSAGAVFRLGILGLTALYFFMFMSNKWKHTFPKDYALVSIGAIGMALMFLLVPLSSVIIDRFGYYLIPIQTMIFTRTPFMPFHVNRTLHSALPYLLLLLVFTVWSQLSNHFQQCYIPYQGWLFGFPGGYLLGF